MTRARILVGLALALGGCAKGGQDQAAAAVDAAPSPPTRRAVIEAAAAPLLRGEHPPAIVVVLITPAGDELLAFGEVGPGGGPPDGDTLFEIGSVTKVFTALLLQLHADEGRVRLEQPVAELLGAHATLPEAARGITLLQLAIHRSGLPRLPANLDLSSAVDPYADYDDAMLYAALAEVKLDAAPGEAYGYSNLGAGLLGHALALAAGKPYEALVHERILAPLGLAATGFGEPPPDRRFAAGHDLMGRPAGRWRFQVLAPAGALWSSADDMVRFVRAQLGLAAVDTALASAIPATHEPRADAPIGRIALGWHIGDATGGHWHNGGTGGYHSFVAFHRQRRVGVVVLAAISNNAVDEIGGAAMKLLLAEPEPQPQP